MTDKIGAAFTLPAEREQAFWEGVQEARRFFKGEADVQQALERLARLLASGLSAPHRLKDLADVLELIRHLSLPREMADSLDGSVRPKYEELWQAAQAPERE